MRSFRKEEERLAASRSEPVERVSIGFGLLVGVTHRIEAALAYTLILTCNSFLYDACLTWPFPLKASFFCLASAAASRFARSASEFAT